MGSSYTNFRGHGFWSRDQLIEELAGEVAAAIDQLPSKDPWLIAVREHWKLQASGIFNGWVHLQLDEFLPTEEKRLVLRGLVAAVTNRRAEDDLIHRTGVLFLRLLDGELETDASSPLDYMIRPNA